MIPKSLSASALLVAEACPARYHSEYILRSPQPQNPAAALGTTVHAALEWYVKTVYIDKTREPSLDYLLQLFRMHYATEFGTFDTDSDNYRDGVEMLKAWFKRTDFDEREVISCELKTSYPIQTSAGEIPFNYIWDRFDRIGDNEYEVIDYKSIRVGFQPNALRNKIQARIYGLMAQILKPDAQRIWVTFDLLRHDGPVSAVFSRADNIATWNYIHDMAEKILATPETDLPETLNVDCRWCVRKVNCTALQGNVAGGGIFTKDKVDEDLVDFRAMLDYQRKAIEQVTKELDAIILAQALREDAVIFESPDNQLEIGWSSRRAVDPERVFLVLGNSELFNKYDGPLMNYTTFNKLLKDRAVTPEMKEQLKSLVYVKRGEPTVKVAAKNPIDD